MRHTYEGKAIGGPRDGVKLTAPLSWNGKIRLPEARVTSSSTNYPGTYVFDEYEWVWTWFPDFTAANRVGPARI